MVAPLLENLSHSFLLAKVLLLNVFDAYTVLSAEQNSVVAHLIGQRLCKTRQIEQIQTVLAQLHCYGARMCQVHQGALQDHAVKATQVASQLIAVALNQSLDCPRIGGRG